MIGTNISTEWMAISSPAIAAHATPCKNGSLTVPLGMTIYKIRHNCKQIHANKKVFVAIGCNLIQSLIVISYMWLIIFYDFSDKLVELIPAKMAYSRRKGEFIRRILEQYEQISQEDISDHTVSFMN